MLKQNNELDLEVLTLHLEEHVEGFKGPVTATKFSGGQSNPTFKLETPSGVYVLRRQPVGKLLKSAHAVDREFRVINALQNTDVPVPKVYYLCEDTAIVGSMFYIMEFSEGHVYWSAALTEVEDNATRTAMYSEMNRVLAALHSVDLDAAGLSDFGRPGNYFERQYSRWSKQYRASELQKIPAMDTLIEWLEANLPEDDGKVSLTHGDYRLDNMMFAPDNSKVVAVLDWELSTLGHPYADLAYQCMQLRLPAAQNRNAMSAGLDGVDAAALGIPSETEYVAMYCARMNIEKIDNWSFYLAFSFFRLASIAQGVARRAVDGNASSSNASRVGEMVPVLAEMGLAATSE